MMFATIAACLIAAAPMAEAGQAGFQSWTGPRYDMQAVFPAGMFRLVRESDNGDGAEFVSADGAVLIVYATANPNPVPIRDYIRGRERAEDGRVTYRHIGIAHAVISGRRGDRIFYQRYEFDGVSDLVRSYRLEYPARLQGRYGPIVSRIRVGRGR